ncbi:hypothetical protein KIPB_006229 [Kipferlia bialata]|uniref:Uncharacterized protein n=1 Tax=Kipferlia bialata TaxID=797122 RepID=A0A391NWM2_9EUKA|nr:hypothetical protein KIPB_006229 [Kipferlia bialata]|eukprot:g6229.t1
MSQNTADVAVLSESVFLDCGTGTPHSTASVKTLPPLGYEPGVVVANWRGDMSLVQCKPSSTVSDLRMLSIPASVPVGKEPGKKRY